FGHVLRFQSEHRWLPWIRIMHARLLSRPSATVNNVWIARIIPQARVKEPPAEPAGRGPAAAACQADGPAAWSATDPAARWSAALAFFPGVAAWVAEASSPLSSFEGGPILPQRCAWPSVPTAKLGRPRGT